MRFSIIIPAYNNVRYTTSCVESIFKNTRDFEIILIDNGSSDATREIGKAFTDRYKDQFVYKRLDENKGFSVAVNIGLHLAKGKYLIVLNNDTVTSPGWADKMADCMENASSRVGVQKVGIVGPASNKVAGLQQVPNVNAKALDKIDDFSNSFYTSNRYNWVFVGFLSGFCMMIRRDAYESIGSFDERFGIGGFEDNDYIIRANRAGWASVICGDAFVWHHCSQTINLPQFSHTSGGLANWKPFFDKWAFSGSKDRDQRLIVYYRIKNGEQWIKRSLDQTAKFADGVVVLDTGSNDNTLKIVTKHPSVLKVAKWTGIDNERDQRNGAIELARQCDPDWILCLDADEIMEDSFTRAQAQRLMKVPDPSINAYGFNFYTFWDKKNWRSDGIFGHMAHARMFRNMPDYWIRFGTERGLHCSNIAVSPVDSKRVTSFRIKHYGYDNPKIRQQKYEYYSKLDKTPDPRLVGAKSYRHLITKNVSLHPWVENNAISLCMIVKNEDYNLWRFLGQQNGWNELVIVDTGSSDSTVEVAKAFGAKVFEHEWQKSFSEARNFAKAQATGKWVVHLDPDEILDPNSQAAVRRITEDSPDGYLVYVKNIQRDGRVTMSETIRVYRNIPELVYSGRVHESFDPILKQYKDILTFNTAPFQIIHQGYLKAPEKVQSKLDQYAKLNKLQMQDDEDDPRPYYNIALHKLNDGKIIEAEELLLTAVEKSESFYQPRKELGIVYLRKSYKWFVECLKTIPTHNPLRAEIQKVIDSIVSYIGESDLKVGQQEQL